jgi:hypothetical protein
VHMTRNQEVVKCDNHYVPTHTILSLQASLTPRWPKTSRLVNSSHGRTL